VCADDAGATQFRVEYDAEQYPTNQLALPLHALLEGPALVFYNDAPFSESDLHALILISRGSKQERAGKCHHVSIAHLRPDAPSRADQIGRYGLGFNAVYNVTDTPMLLTRDKLVVFDPQLEYLRSWASDKEPGESHTPSLLVDTCH
jgi:sacsin